MPWRGELNDYGNHTIRTQDNFTAPSALLIGGTSHVGKSTLARWLAQKTDWDAASTDQLARHPGRPWTTESWALPAHVAQHYADLGADELMTSVLAHYTGMLPAIRSYIQIHFADRPAQHLVLEGSALLPESVVQLGLPKTSVIYLTADDDLIASRILRQSGYKLLGQFERMLVDKFVARTVRMNDFIVRDARRFGLQFINVSDQMSAAELAEQSVMQAQGLPI